MKAFVSKSLICAFALGMIFAGSLNAQTPSADTARYGPYPTNYKEIIMPWLNKQLIDPDSARIEWDGEPKPSDVGKGSEAVSGYLVNFTVTHEIVSALIQASKNILCSSVMAK